MALSLTSLKWAFPATLLIAQVQAAPREHELQQSVSLPFECEADEADEASQLQTRHLSVHAAQAPVQGVDCQNVSRDTGTRMCSSVNCLGGFQMFHPPGPDYCYGPNLFSGISEGREDCEAKCSADTRCKYYSHWRGRDDNHCKLTERCDSFAQAEVDVAVWIKREEKPRTVATAAQTCRYNCRESTCGGFSIGQNKSVCVTPETGFCITGYCVTGGTTCGTQDCNLPRTVDPMGQVCFTPCTDTIADITQFVVRYEVCKKPIIIMSGNHSS